MSARVKRVYVEIRRLNGKMRLSIGTDIALPAHHAALKRIEAYAIKQFWNISQKSVSRRTRTSSEGMR